VKGDVRNKKDVMLRVHSKCLTGDTFFLLNAIADPAGGRNEADSKAGLG